MVGPGPGPEFAAVILAGGRGRRLGGADKPALLVGGRSLLEIALAAAAGRSVVVVGPDRDLPIEVRSAREEPIGGGPAAGVAAGFLALPPLGPAALVAVLAADLPGVTAATLARLQAALAAARAGDLVERQQGAPAAARQHAGTSAQDATGGGLRVGAGGQDAAGGGLPVGAGGQDPPGGGLPVGAVLLDATGRRQDLTGVWRYDALAAAIARRTSWHNVSVRDLLAPMQVVEVPGVAGEADDIDTPADLRHWQSGPEQQ